MGGSVSLLFFPAVMVPAAYGGYGPGIVAAAMAALSMAYFFIPPAFILDIGIDDGIRLVVFGSVALTSAWLSARRRQAETAQMQSMRQLEANLVTLQRVSGWPMSIGPDTSASVQQMLKHAAAVIVAGAAAVAWETEDEPLLYVASTAVSPGLLGEAVAVFAWRSEPPHGEIVRRIGQNAPAS